MKVILLDIKGASARKCVNKDLSGGMGTATWVGDSFLARVFERVKKTNVVLPEITIAYLAAIFKKFGWEAEVAEIKIGLENFRKKADLVLVLSSIVDCGHELAIVGELKEKGYHVGVFGSFATAVPEFFSKADFVIKGEPEAGAWQIASHNLLPKGIMEVAPIADLNSLPYPDWSFFPIKKYSYSPALNKKPVVAMLASRGCPYGCSFYCPYSINSGRTWRARSVDNVIGEMEYLKKNYGVKAVDFRDPVFTLNRERTVKLAQAMIKNNLGIIWSCETRIDCLDKELILIMKQAGLRHINAGVESFNEEVLKKSKRLPIRAVHQEEIISFCHKNGISVAAFYIIGLEGDTKASVKETIKYAKKLNTLVAQFTISTPYPGTEFFNQAKAQGRLLTQAWEQYDIYTPVVEHENLSSADQLELKEEAFIAYYFRPRYLLTHMPKYLLQKFLWPF
ncbi:MAG: radical SAM protein [bacterium]|nr:radical SAM protein [bacterium]